MLPGSSDSNPAPTGNNGKSYRPRRPHSKTRTGCRTCRQRKVKCDETRPVCKNCSKRGLHSECEYRDTVVWVSQPPIPNASVSLSRSRASASTGTSAKSSNTTSPASAISHSPRGIAITGPASPADSSTSTTSTTNTSIPKPHTHFASPRIAHASTPPSAYSFTPAKNAPTTLATSTPVPTSVPFLLNPRPPPILPQQTTSFPSNPSFFTAPGPLPTPPIYTTAPVSTTPSISPSLTSSNTNLTTLYLFHLFTTRIYATFNMRHGIRAIWRDYAPSLALQLAFTGRKNEFLLHSILSVAALNVASMAPDREKRNKWMVVASEEHQLSLEGFRDAVARHAVVVHDKWRAVTAASAVEKVMIEQQQVHAQRGMGGKDKEVRGGKSGMKRRRSGVADQVWGRNFGLYGGDGATAEAGMSQDETNALFLSSGLLFVYGCSLATLGIQDDEGDMDHDDDEDDNDDGGDGNDADEVDIENQHVQEQEDEKNKQHGRNRSTQMAQPHSPAATSSSSTTPAAQILTPPPAFATHFRQATQLPPPPPPPSKSQSRQYSISQSYHRSSSTLLAWLPLLRGNAAMVRSPPRGLMDFHQSKLAPFASGLQFRTPNHPYVSVLSNLSTELMRYTLHPHLPQPIQPLSKATFDHAIRELTLTYEMFYSLKDPISAALVFPAELQTEFVIPMLGKAGGEDWDRGALEEVSGGYIGDRDPRALVIMAHFLVLMVILEFVLPGEKESIEEEDEGDEEQGEVDSCDDDDDYDQDGDSEDEDVYNTHKEQKPTPVQPTILPLTHTTEAYHHKDNSSTSSNTNPPARGRHFRKIPYSRMRDWWLSGLGRREIRDIARYLREVDEEEWKVNQQYRHEENYPQHQEQQQQNQFHHLLSPLPLPHSPMERGPSAPTHTSTTRLYPPPPHAPPLSQLHTQLPHQPAMPQPPLALFDQQQQSRKMPGRWTKWIEWPLEMIKGDLAARMAHEHYHTQRDRERRSGTGK